LVKKLKKKRNCRNNYEKKEKWKMGDKVLDKTLPEINYIN